MRFKEGDKVTYEGKKAVVVECHGLFMPTIQFEDGRKLHIAYPEKLKYREKVSIDEDFDVTRDGDMVQIQSYYDGGYDCAFGEVHLGHLLHKLGFTVDDCKKALDDPRSMPLKMEKILECTICGWQGYDDEPGIKETHTGNIALCPACKTDTLKETTRVITEYGDLTLFRLSMNCYSCGKNNKKTGMDCLDQEAVGKCRNHTARAKEKESDA